MLVVADQNYSVVIFICVRRSLNYKFIPKGYICISYKLWFPS
jgi:hypothetical protein